MFEEVPLVVVNEDDGSDSCSATTVLTLSSMKPHIGVKEEANSYMVTNRWILNGYRINYDSWKETLKSLFQIHNETINIWTHLIGFFVCLASFIILTSTRVISDPFEIRKNTKHLMYLVQGEEGAPVGDEEQSALELPSMDFGYIES